ncbi:MAG TPA: AraC family transcriptional regulator [Ruminococcus sp.]
MNVNKIKVNFKYDPIKQNELSGSNGYLVMIFNSSVSFFNRGEKIECGGRTFFICRGMFNHICDKRFLSSIFGFIRFEMNSDELNYLKHLGIPINEPIRLSDGYSVVTELFRCMFWEYGKNSAMENEFSSQALKLIFIKVSDIIKSRKNEVQLPVHFHSLSCLREQVLNNPLGKFNIDDICKEMCIGRVYFHRIYLAAFGTTFMQDVINSRLNMAKRLLVETNNSVSLIAEKCGYENDSYFMRQFKSHIGITPSEYRKKYSDMLINE